MKSRRIDMTAGYIFGILVLLLAGIMFLVVFGAKVYGATVQSQDRANDRRALTSFVAVSVKNHDSAGAVTIEPGPEGDMLVMTGVSGDKTYATRIYLREGELVQEFGTAENGPGTGAVQTIGPCDAFQAETVLPGLFRFTVDGCQVYAYQRSTAGGQA